MQSDDDRFLVKVSRIVINIEINTSMFDKNAP